MNQLISHHILLCATSNKSLCCTAEEGEKSWQKLKNLLHDLNLDDPNRPEGIVLRSKVDCLRICKNGPIMLIWPEGIWYQSVSPENIELIIKSHILKGNFLEQYFLMRTALNSCR